MNPYNETIEEIKKCYKIRMFLRFDPTELLTDFDDNYIANQLDSCNFFYEWFCSPRISYIKMLKHQHALAALGQSGTNTYLIKGYFRTRDGGNSNWDLRDNHAGETRYELHTKCIPHAHMDLLRIAPNEYGIYSDENYFRNIYNPRTRRIDVMKAEQCVVPIITSRHNTYMHSFTVRKNRYFYVKHPEGEDFKYLQKMAHEKMNQLLKYKEYTRLEDNSLFSNLALYYQIFIVWMPFAHINNSLVWGQINAILNYFGYKGVPHGKLDSYAMLLSSNKFEIIFNNHIKSYQK